MNASSQYATQRDRWANELWNVSLLPSVAANEVAQPYRQLRLTAQITDEMRSESSSRRPLRVIERK